MTDYLVRGCKTVKQRNGDVYYAEIDIPESATMVDCPMMKTNDYVGIAFFDKEWNYMGCAYNREGVAGTHFTYRIPQGARILRYAYRGFEFDYIRFFSDSTLTVMAPPVEKTISDDLKNPVISRNWPDPTIAEYEGRYYSIATGCESIYESENMVVWKDMGKKPFTNSEMQKLKQLGKYVWAPDLIKVDSCYLLYVALWNSNHDCCIVVCKSKYPYGPFSFSNILTSSSDNGIEQTIDPECVIDSIGKKWLFFGSSGGIHRVELSDDGLHINDHANYVHVAGLSNKIKDVCRETIFEGAYLYRHKGYWYLFVSYGSHTANYGLKVGRSKELTGIFKDKEGGLLTEGNGTTILKSEVGDRMFDPGHCGEIFTDKSGRTYMFYHSHVNGISQYNIQTENCTRTMCLQEIFWDKDGWPYFEKGKPQLIINVPNI